MNDPSVRSVIAILTRTFAESVARRRLFGVGAPWRRRSTGLSCAARLASVVSKWVGDTAKNLARLFQAAPEHRAVVVFDEADALFARRVGVRTSQDRFANAETGARLSEVERHEGVVVLTTNLVEEIDPAFERRLHLRVAFPSPDAAARAATWRKLLPADAPLAVDVDARRLRRSFALSGGTIRDGRPGRASRTWRSRAPTGSRERAKRRSSRAVARARGHPPRRQEAAVAAPQGGLDPLEPFKTSTTRCSCPRSAGPSLRAARRATRPPRAAPRG